MPRAPKPTASELQILHVLWRRGPSTVNQVQPELQHGDRVAYTTVLKLLQIMTEKKLVLRDESERTHVYRAAYSEDQTQQHLVSDLISRAFEGSAAKLVLQALNTGKASPEELDAIRKLIDSHRGSR